MEAITQTRKEKIYKIVDEKEGSPEWGDPVATNYELEKFKEELPMEPSIGEIEEHGETMGKALRGE